MTKQTKISDCKHPNSRKTRSLIKQIKKASRKDKHKTEFSIKQNVTGEKIVWFRDNLESECPLTANQFKELIDKYLARFNEELEQIRIKHSIGNRKNRQHASREDIINMTIKRDIEEFNTCGLEVPDLLDPGQFEMVKRWNGELRFLQNFRLRRYTNKQLEILEKKAAINKEQKVLKNNGSSTNSEEKEPENTEKEENNDQSNIMDTD